MRWKNIIKFSFIISISLLVVNCSNSTPYNFNEKIAWLTNNKFGPSTKFKELTTFIPEASTLNDITPKLTIAFLGDIMVMPGRHTSYANELKQFLSGVDYLVANFEGTITSNQPGQIATKGSEQILNDLKTLFPAGRTILTNANNHACEYTLQELDRSIQMQRLHGFIPIGLKLESSVLLENKVNVASVTKWTNKPCAYLADIDNSDRAYNPNAAFNILVPELGYEIQLYPRPEQIDKAKELLIKWDMLVGHQSHTPQVITSYKDALADKLVAYSLGDFTTLAKREKYLYGIIVKVEVGPNADGIWQTGKVEWRFSYVNHLDPENSRIELVDGFKHFELPQLNKQEY